MAAGSDHVLVGPDHGRAWVFDHGARPVQPVDALARRTLRESVAAYFRNGDGPGGLRCRARGLDHYRDRTSAVHSLWIAAHHRFRFAVGRTCRRFIANRFRHRLFHRVCGRPDLPVPADGVAAASRRRGTERRHASPCRRHHARSRRDSAWSRPMTAIDLPLIGAFIIAFAVFVYVVMDGFDLGLGILYPLFPNKTDRDVIMNSVAPVWDGNETWLVLGGGGLMAAFPLAYAVLMPALYTPIIAMLLGLIFRGVAFEFRWRTAQSERNRWDLAFAGRSLLAALAQGIALCAILQGAHVEGRHYARGGRE